eukprot:g22279.t1
MIGQHKDTVAELEGRSEVKVKVRMKRARTCVELLKTETSIEDQVGASDIHELQSNS